MAIYIRKDKTEILREALRKLETSTPIKATSPGSIARAFTEAITSEIGDYYDALDFQVAQSVISSASGSSLDLMGDLYNVKRKTVNDIVTIDRKMGAFYFYIDAPYAYDITVPAGTRVYTATNSFVGAQLKYSVAGDAIIPAGSTRVFASITPDFGDTTYTAAPGTLVVHSFVSPAGTVVRCTNPKAIMSQEGYEDDENYRIRIIKAIRVASAGTLDAIRFSLLGVSGVRDVKIEEVPYGLGSFRVIVTPEDINFSRDSGAALSRALNSTRPVGVKAIIVQPDLIAMDVSATIFVKNNLNTQDNEGLQRKCEIAIKRYLNTLLAGGTVVYNRLVQSILEVSPDIIDVNITRYAPNGGEVLRRNYTPDVDEILIPGRIEISLAV